MPVYQNVPNEENILSHVNLCKTFFFFDQQLVQNYQVTNFVDQFKTLSKLKYFLLNYSRLLS